METTIDLNTASPVLTAADKLKNRTQHKKMMTRIASVIGGHTQVILAKALGIRQSSISDAACRRSVPPAQWCITLYEKFGLNPNWVAYGTGPKYLVAADHAPQIVMVNESLESATVDELFDALQKKLPGMEISITRVAPATTKQVDQCQS